MSLDENLFEGQPIVYELDNGLTVLFDKTKNASSVLDVSVGFGAAFEPEKKQGVAHFLEHTIFNGAKKYTKQEIFRTIDEAGGEINAFTLKESTRFFVHILKKHFPKAVDILSDSLKNALFEEKLVELERGVILSELSRSIDDPEDFVCDMLLKEVLSKEFGRRTLGTKETIQKISQDDLINVRNAEYSSNNILIGVSGRFEGEDVVKQVEENFSWNYSAKKKKARFAKTKIKPRHREVFFKRKTELAHFCLGFPVMPAVDAKEFFSFKVINAMLGGGLSSRLNTELREKRGLCYDVHTILQAEANHGFFLVSSSAQVKNLNEMKKLILNEFRKIKEGEINEDELNRVKGYIQGSEAISRESLLRRTEQNLQCWQYFNKTAQECFDLVNNLTLDDVKEVAEKWIQPEKFSLAVITPKKKDLKY